MPSPTAHRLSGKAQKRSAGDALFFAYASIPCKVINSAPGHGKSSILKGDTGAVRKCLAVFCCENDKRVGDNIAVIAAKGEGLTVELCQQVTTHITATPLPIEYIVVDARSNARARNDEISLITIGEDVVCSRNVHEEGIQILWSGLAINRIIVKDGNGADQRAWTRALQG